jgi:Uma2 family endonuclease
MAVEVRRYRFSVDEYHRMAAAGVFGEDDRLELLDGDIVEMSPIGRRHAAAVARAAQALYRLTATRAIVWSQNPIRLGEHSEPQPDIALLRPRDDYYAEALPTPEDVLLVIEVADTSVAVDWRVKLPLYARAGIREAWLLVLPGGDATAAPAGRRPAASLEVHREPSADGYREIRLVAHGESLAPLALPGEAIAAGELLGD